MLSTALANGKSFSLHTPIRIFHFPPEIKKKKTNNNILHPSLYCDMLMYTPEYDRAHCLRTRYSTQRRQILLQPQSSFLGYRSKARIQQHEVYDVRRKILFSNVVLSYNIKDPGVGKCDPSVKHIKKDQQNLKNSRKRRSVYIVQEYYCSSHTGLRISKEQIGK